MKLKRLLGCLVIIIYTILFIPVSEAQIGQIGITGPSGNRTEVDSNKNLLVSLGYFLCGGSGCLGDQVGLSAMTTGGASPYHLIAAATTNATVIKASAGQVYHISAFNINAAPRYIKFYDKATAPTCNSDTVVRTVGIPGATTGGGQNQNIPVVIAFANGISICVTAGIADTNNSAVTDAETIADITYK